MTTLSDRGHRLASSPARADMELFFEAAHNLYDPGTNPDGAFPMNVAENTLMAPDIRSKLDQICKEESIPHWVLQYTDTAGNPQVREIAARFMETRMGYCPVSPDSIGFSAGAAGVIEATAFVLGDPSDAVVIPAPAYPVYTSDMGIKSGLSRYDLQTHYNIGDIGSAAPVTIPLLEKAKKDLESKGKRFRLLVITSPDNPTGCTYDKPGLRNMARWCIRNDIHMIVNEIYAFSRIDTADPLIASDYREEVPFASFAAVMNELDSGYLHLWYGMSKDFAMSGLRFGIVHSLNGEFMNAFRNVNIPHMVSNHTQWMTGELLKDSGFIQWYIRENQCRITAGYKVVVNTLRNLGIPYVPARGSLFIWADLSKYLKEDSDKGQETLWTDIYRNSGVLLTPGIGFGHLKNGMFRIVHTAVPTGHLSVAMERLEGYLKRI